MTWTNAKIENAFIGIEDHDIFAWGLNFSTGCLHQGSGLRGLCAESLPTVEAIVRIFGPWNELKGKLVRIGRDGNQIVAMRDIMDDTKEVVF